MGWFTQTGKGSEEPWMKIESWSDFPKFPHSADHLRDLEETSK